MLTVVEQQFIVNHFCHAEMKGVVESKITKQNSFDTNFKNSTQKKS